MNTYKILVLCTGNSCRSQIAQGFFNYYGQGKIEAYSAGLEAHGVNPSAIRVMNEIGINISHHSSDIMEKYLDQSFNVVLTVCDHAQENCPVFPTSICRLHENFKDPAKARGTDEEIIQAFRQVRDDIGQYVKKLITTLGYPISKIDEEE